MATTKIAQIGTDDDIEQRFSDSLFRTGLRRLRRDWLTLIALSILAIMGMAALFAPQITSLLQVDEVTTAAYDRLAPIGTPGHVFGTDNLGRDMLARLLYGGRVSLSIGISAAGITLAIGLLLGLITGYFGGVVDDLMNWVITTLDSLPSLYLLIIVSALFRPSPEALVLVIALTGWTGATRLIRGQTIALRDWEYITAARAAGASPWRIMFVHIFPNLISILIIALTLSIGGVILGESALSFLGLGVQPPYATWGNMLSDSQRYFRSGPHMVFLPGMMIFTTVLCLYVIGDGLRDAFDPRTVQNKR